MEGSSKVNKGKAKRNQMIEILPASSIDEFQQFYDLYGYECAITKSTKNINVDHFIPLNWGHGGHNIGNVYFLNKKLNTNKSSKNPFKWASHMKWSRKEQEAWNKLIKRLAALNGLSVSDFKKYVNWCEKNKRTLEEVMQDNRSSIAIWKETVKRNK